MIKVYNWMILALFITGIVAVFVSTHISLVSGLILNEYAFIGLCIAELILVWYLRKNVRNMTIVQAAAAYIIYSVLNGVTFSVIFLAYTATSIAYTFFVCSGVFLVASIYGMTTNKDLSRWGSVLMVTLICLILVSILNFFFASSMIYWITTYVGILLFIGLTIYDTQKIQKYNIIGNEGTEEDRKEALMGALELYLDFINLFLYLLRVLGRRK